MKKEIKYSTIFFVVITSILISILLLNFNKTLFGTMIFLFFILIYLTLSFKIGLLKANKYLLFFIIFTIPFPYLIQFFGKDALTVTTSMIYFLFISVAVVKFLRKDKMKKEKLISNPFYIFPILIFVSLTISLIKNPIFIGQSVRYYVAYLSAILLYFLLIDIIEKRSEILIIINIILLGLACQSAISFLQWKFPSIVVYLSPFGTRVFSPEARIVYDFTRATGTVWSYEILGEWFFVGAILSIALIYETRKPIYYLPIFYCLVGIMLTKTRSVMLLFVFAVLLSLLLLKLFRKDYKNNAIKIVFAIFLFAITLYIAFPEQAEESIRRLNIYFNSFYKFSPKAINRKEVWESALRLFLQKPTLFGQGLFNVESLGYSDAGWFHSLYLTLIYKVGVFGLTVYVIFWCLILKENVVFITKKVSNLNWYISFFFFIIILSLLIDGIKIEYLRYAHTMQFMWLLYALSVATVTLNRRNSENIMVF